MISLHQELILPPTHEPQDAFPPVKRHSSLPHSVHPLPTFLPRDPLLPDRRCRRRRLPIPILRGAGVPKRSGLPRTRKPKLCPLMRPIPCPHRNDPRLRLPPRLHRRRPLRPPPLLMPGKRLLPLRRRRVRPGESTSPDPVSPIHFPFSELQSSHLS